MSIEEEINRAQRAKLLLDDELLAEAFTILESEYTQAWKESLEREGDKRDRLWLMLRLLQRVRGHLLEVMEAGKVAQHKLDEKESFATRLRKVI